jgi:hypothetical protein
VTGISEERKGREEGKATKSGGSKKGEEGGRGREGRGGGREYTNNDSPECAPLAM